MMVITADSVVKGVVNDGVSIFRGIVYAEYSRFRPAVLKPLSGEVDATVYGALCPQRSSRLASLTGSTNGISMEEGKLCLSIYAPQNASLCPVMVWIHGGAYLTGGSEDPRYGAERLVRTGGVVVVKISYRLGAEGYLYAPSGGIANLGLDDQWKALQWIHEHIADFGGNPQDVTLFGQSAGAHSVQSLIATYDSHPLPLFHKAILQSSPFGIRIGKGAASRITKAFVKKLRRICGPSSDIHNAVSSDVLFSASVDQILDAQQACAHLRPGMTFMPVLPDCTRVPDSAHNLRVVVGYTAQDVSPFVLPSLGRLAGSTPARGIVRILTRRFFISGAERYVSKMRDLGMQVYTYRADWCPAGSVWGACHCIELPFILGEYEDWSSAEMLKGMTRSEFEEHSRSCLSAWTGFASTGVFPPISL